MAEQSNPARERPGMTTPDETNSRGGFVERLAYLVISLVLLAVVLVVVAAVVGFIADVVADVTRDPCDGTSYADMRACAESIARQLK